MRILEYKEQRIHGSRDFPVEIYLLDRNHPRYVMPLHWHEAFEIIYIEKGCFHYDIGQKKGVAEAGDILFVNNGDLHAGVPDNSEYICIVFEPGIFTKDTPAASNKILSPLLNGDINILLNIPRQDSEIPMILHDIHNCLVNKPFCYELQVNGLLYYLLGKLLQKQYYYKNPKIIANQKRLEPIKNALSLIEKEYASPITLEQLANAANMSPKYFCCFFKQMTRYSPVEYLNRHRIEAACNKIISGRKNITELAYECGFNDLSYFIRVFKKIVGVTPKKYAQQRQSQHF